MFFWHNTKKDIQKAINLIYNILVVVKMKMLVVSDSHMYNDILENITNKWKNKVDLLVRVFDSCRASDFKKR